MADRAGVDSAGVSLQGKCLEIIRPRYRRRNRMGAAVARGTVDTLMAFGVPEQCIGLLK